MCRPINLLLLLLFFTLSCSLFTTETVDAPSSQPDIEADVEPDTESDIELDAPPTSQISSDWTNRDVFKKGLIPAQQHILEEMPGATTYHLDLNIADDLTHISGSQEVRYTNQEDIALDEVYFHLMPNYLGDEMLISLVEVDGASISFELEMDDTVMRIPLASPLQVGESVIIKTDFLTTVPTQLESNYGILAYTENVLALAHAYPTVSVYDDEGWNIDIPSEQGDVTYLETSFFIVRVNAPKNLVVVASGSEITRKEEGDRQVIQYAAGPARDFYLAASEDYIRIQKDFGDYVINSYAPINMQAGSQMALDFAAVSIDLFSEKYAPYPYTEFDIVTTPTYALGIEYPGMTAINIDIYDLDASYSIYLESTIVHEVGHQWFYHLVGNDQLDEPWLDESLTQYITWQYYLDQYGASGGAEFEQSLGGRWQRLDEESVPIGMPVSAYTDGEYSAIIYGRGAFFFEALEKEMGTEKFDAFLTDYTQSHQWEVATKESMREFAEKHCGCDLESLFVEWVYPLE